MWGLRLGDDIDDYCTKCKRLTNHSVLSIVEDAPAKVRCRTCYHEQDFRDGIAPPTRKELKKAELFKAVLGEKSGNEETQEEAPEPKGKKAAKKR